MKHNKSGAKGREARDILTDLVAAAQSTLSKCLADLRMQAKDLGFRNDPRARDLYTRYDALDAFVAFYESIIGICLEEAETCFLTSLNSDPSQVSSTPDDLWQLQVIETEEIDLASASAPLVESLTQRFREPLLHLELRLEFLNYSLSEQVNPKGWHPHSLMNAFQLGIHRLSIKLAGKVLLCEFFQHQLMVHLEQFYSKANRILSDHGIVDNKIWLENAIYIKRLETQTSALSRRRGLVKPALTAIDKSATDGVKQAAQTDRDRLPVQEDIAAKTIVTDHGSNNDCFIHFLLAPDSPGTGSMLSPYQRAQIVGALSWVQREYALGNVPLSNEEIKNSAARKLYDSGIFNASDLVDRETPAMDFVNQIFLTVSKDKTLSETVKSLLCKLHIPTIKLALLDFEFFKNKQHPARETLNYLTKIAVGIVDEKDPLLTKLRAIVSQILKRFDTEVSVFENALTELKKLALSESERIQKTEAAAQRRAYSDARYSTAKSTVVGVVKHYLTDRELPCLAMKFLQACWAPLMIAIYHDQGTKSPLWEQSIHGLRHFIKACYRGEFHQEIHGIISLGESLAAKLKDKVNKSSRTDGRLLKILAELRGRFRDFKDRFIDSRLHNQLVSPILTVDELSADEGIDTLEIHPLATDDSSTLRQAPSTLLVTPGGQIDRLNKPVLGSAPLASDERPMCHSNLNDLPACVKPGTWFEVHQAQGRAKRHLKLSAILHETGEILFANRFGEKELIIDMATFVEDLSKGFSKTIEDSDLFDRALNSVINNIRKAQHQRLQGDC